MSWRTLVNCGLGILLGFSISTAVGLHAQAQYATTQEKEINQLSAQLALVEGRLNYFPKIRTGP